MGVCGQVIRVKKSADLEEHGNGLTVIARHTGYEVLRRLDTTGRRLGGHARNRDRHTGTSRIGIQRFIANHDALGRIGRKQAQIGYVGGDCDRLILRGCL